MKRIAIFCDGTWNKSDAAHPTNVVRLAQAVRRTDASGTKQCVLYLEGVGSGVGSTAVARWFDRLLGGALGWGLDLNIVEAFRSLVFLYEPGDEIFIFGFSRGAYTARSLAGFIRSTGIPDRTALGVIPEAMERYRTRGDDRTKPGSEESYRFRLRTSPQVVTSRGEADWRLRNGHPVGTLLKISYLGVWDTVGALGVPSHFRIALFTNAKYQFHDTALSSSVASARHAVAVDEHRTTFPPALWENLAELNQKATVPQAYQQHWFPGDHGSVGGGGEIRMLSSDALLWIAEGATKAGLELEPGFVVDTKAEVDHLGPLRNTTKRGGFFDRITRLGHMDRNGPETDADLAPATKHRLENDPGYRPKTLAHL